MANLQITSRLITAQNHEINKRDPAKYSRIPKEMGWQINNAKLNRILSKEGCKEGAWFGTAFHLKVGKVSLRGVDTMSLQTSLSHKTSQRASRSNYGIHDENFIQYRNGIRS